MFTGGDIVALLVGLLTLVGVIYAARKTSTVASHVGQTNGSGTIATMLEDSIEDRVEIKAALASSQSHLDQQLAHIMEVQQRHDQRDELCFKALFEHVGIERPPLPDLNP